MLTTLIVAASAFMAQPGTGLPSCYHPDPWYYYKYTREQPPECSDYCWAVYQGEMIAAVGRYAGCCSQCIHNYPSSDPALCYCFQACGAAFAIEANLYEADLWICMAQ